MKKKYFQFLRLFGELKWGFFEFCYKLIISCSDLGIFFSQTYLAILAFSQNLENIFEWAFYPKLFQIFLGYYYGQYFLFQVGILSAPRYICFPFPLKNQYNNLEA